MCVVPSSFENLKSCTSQNLSVSALSSEDIILSQSFVIHCLFWQGYALVKSVRIDFDIGAPYLGFFPSKQ